MAARAAETDTFFAGPLIADLAAAGDAVAVAPIARWAELPAPDAIMPQEAFANYLLAHIALARHGIEAPVPSPQATAAGRALAACGQALHAANRADLTSPEREARLSASWEALAGEPGAALVVLADCCEVRNEALRRLPGDGIEPAQILDGREGMVVAFARAALADANILSGFFQRRSFEPDAAIRFALGALARWGDTSDLGRLRAASRVSTLADGALDAIQRLEARLFMATHLTRDR
jgi:hypothetical protein